MGMEAGMKAAGFGPQIKNYVFCRRPQESTVPTFEFVNEPVKTFAQRLRAQPGKHIWMMGGEIIASFLDQGEIDEFRINVIPILHRRRHPPDSTSPSLHSPQAPRHQSLLRRRRPPPLPHHSCLVDSPRL